MTVPAEGPLKCIMALVGEAPGETEEVMGRPFVGQAGSILNTKLHLVGLSRQECYITNLVKERPRGNDFSVFWTGSGSNRRPTQELELARDSLLQELDRLDTNIVVCLGANALWALTGYTQIGKWRGSLIGIQLPSGRPLKVLGTYHPAAVLRQWEFGAIMQFDLKKAKREANSASIERLERELLIAPTFLDVVEYCSKNRDVSFDIETSPSEILCCSLAYTCAQAMSIPVTMPYWGSFSRLKTVLECIGHALTTSNQNIGQNITFDIQYLIRFFGILPSKPWFDTMIAQHSCYCELPKALSFLTSIYTNEPFYKDDLKVWVKGESDIESLWRYNARDACVTYEICEELKKEMTDLGAWSTYNFSMELLEPLLYMMLRGVRVDTNRMREHIDSYNRKIVELEARFKGRFGDVNPRSPKQMAELAYNTLGLKPVTRDGKPSVDKKALDKLALRSPDIRLAADIRSEKTIKSNYLVESILDTIDHRLRCSFNSTGTETRRLSSSESVFGSGRNLQNFPKKVRDMIVADEGMMFTEADLSGAESRVVAYLSEDPNAIRIFEEGGNIHEFTACEVFKVSSERVKEDKKEKDLAGADTESLYFRAKKLRHSVEKVGSWVTVSEQLKIPAAEAKELIKRFYALNPNLLTWFREVEAKLKKDRTIVTPFGDKRIFFSRFGPQMVKDAVAHIAQDVVGKVINTGIINIYNTLCKQYKGIEVLLQVHDAVLVQHSIEHLPLIREELPRLMRVEIPYKGGYFVIPVDLKSGKNWRDLG